MNLERSGTTTGRERELQVKLYEKNSASATGALVSTKIISFDTAEATRRAVFSGLDVNKFYYIYFYNSSSDSSGSSLDISGQITIDDSYIS